ncbi:L,D-transpeptidase [Actinocorallia populi]|uniref:L,D-transpeptidase n=1 Tax=Actinocorallia populi TaxID=2079200 RepID=UPI0018E50214|nr:Ig-like domain-containing protein [Actinocorallia populi]
MPVYRAVTRAGAAGLLLAPLLVGCSQEEQLPPRAGVVISPVNTAVKPDTPIVVRAREGTLQNVSVQDAQGAAVEGVLADDASTWTSRYPLAPGGRYRVKAAVLGTDGQMQTGDGSFTTTRPRQTVEGTVLFPEPRETVGVGMAIKIGFDREVTDKEAVERALEVRSSKPVEGAWRWFDDRNVIFRPKEYWPAYTKVRVLGHLTGVPIAGGHYGAKNVDLEFNVGERIESFGDARKYRVVVKRNGKTVRTMPASMGKGGVRKYTTTSGVHLTMEKEYMTVMTSPGIGPGQPGYYRQNVNWTVRISSSGEYLHSAPWSVGSQGRANVSHGCINLSPADGKWFHNISHRGDPMTVTGTDRELEPENGWGYWQLNWKQWLEGSKAQGFTTGTLAGSAQPAGAREAAGSPGVQEGRQELRSP